MDLVLKIVTVLLFMVVFKHSAEAFMALSSARKYVIERYGKVTMGLFFSALVVITALEGGLLWLFVKYVIFGG